MRSTLRKHSRSTYQPTRRRVAYHAQAADLDRLMKEAVLRLREETREPLGIDAQAYSDVLRGRPLGTRTLARIAIAAVRAKAAPESIMRLASTLEAWLLSLLPAAECIRTAAHMETVEQGEADSAVLEAAFAGDRPRLDEAIARTMDHLAAQRRLLAALVATRSRLGVA
jgi:hypothetical protein